MSNQFDEKSGQLLFHHQSGRAVCNVFEDDFGNQRIINTADVGVETQLNLDIKAATYHPKQHRFFDEKVREGWRIIGRIPMWYFAQHPEIRYDDKELEKCLDAHPEWKAIDVYWTKTTPAKGLVSGGLG
jgi:hypothetical protein